MESNFKTTITKASKDLTKIGRVKLMDTSDCLKLDELSKQGEVTFSVDYFALLSVHNEAATGNQDYEQIVIVAPDGTRYCTGSENFIRRFLAIAEELDGEDYEVKVLRRPSRKYAGKEFLTCALA